VRRTKRTALVLILFALLLAGAPVHSGVASPLTGTLWCTDKASMALLAGSSGTGQYTTGYSSPDGTYQPTAYGWWARLARQAQSNFGTTSANYSHGGAQASDFLADGRWSNTTGAVGSIEATRPRLTIISLGTNEYLGQVPPAEFAANLADLVSRVQAANPAGNLMLTTQWTAYVPAPTYPWSQYAQAIRDVAVSHSAAMLDLRQYIPPASDPDWARFYHPDRIHLLDHAHLIVSAAVATRALGC
jgi:acyl-CoA thioesterase-1